MQIQSSTSSPVAQANRAKRLGTGTPVAACSPWNSRVTVAALPSDGTVLLGNGFTPVRLRQTLSLAQLGTLQYRPAPSSEARLPTSYLVLSVPQNSGARTIGIQISAPESYAIITELPANGTLLLSDGTTAVTHGQTLTAAQLKRLRVRPAIDAVGHISTLNYLVVGPPGGPVAGCVLLIVAPATPPPGATGRSPPAPASVATETPNIRPGDARAGFSTGNQMSHQTSADVQHRRGAEESLTTDLAESHAGDRGQRSNTRPMSPRVREP